MSLISRVEISNYLTEGLETNHFANWNPMLTGITLRMDSKSALVNITNGGGKTSMAELLLYLLSRDKTLLSHLRDKTAPKGRGYTHARIEFRDTDTSSFREPGLLEVDVDNLHGSTRVIGVAINNDVADAPIFYSYSGTLEDSPCYTITNSVLQNVPDDLFVKRTRAIPGSQWNTFRNVTEWQEHVGLSISMDVVRRNATYQAKGSDDKNASFFNFKPRNGESYDSAFFKAVIAPDLLTNLLNSFSEEGESSIGDTLHISLSHIVNSERDIARKQENLERRESAIGVDLKPVVDAGAKANNAHAAMQAALRAVRKDVTLLHHFGSQNSPCAIPGLPRPVTSLVRPGDQDSRISKAIKGMVISRDDGILILDKTLSELAGVEVRVITQIAERKKISHSALNSQVIDFACDFGFSTSGKAGGGHYRKGYPRQSIAALLPLFAETSGATLEGLEDVFKAAFDIAESQIDTNPASLKILGLEARLATNSKTLGSLQKQSEDLANAIEGIENQIKGRAENEDAWKEFSAIASHLPEHLRSEPKKAKEWLADEVGKIQLQLADMNKRQGALTEGWTHYLAALEEAGLEGLDGIRKQYADLVDAEKQIKNDGKRAQTNLDVLNGKTLKFERDVLNAENALRLCESVLKNMEELKSSFALFLSYFGDVDPLGVDDPYKTAQEFERKKLAAEQSLQSSKAEWSNHTSLRAGASRFNEIFGSDIDPLTFDPNHEHRTWTANESLAQQGLLPLEPFVTALESFAVKFPGQSPAEWIEKTDIRRRKLELEKLELEGNLKKSGLEIEALDRLAVVDDASFGRAWNLLGDGPQRLYALLQGMDGRADRRVGALSALTGLLSAPVFDSLEALETAAEMLEQHNIGIPLLLKEPLLKAVGAQGDLGGELRVMSFFAGRYSRQAKILLDPEFAQKERALLVSRVANVTLELNELVKDIEQVDFRSQDYVLATKALEAIKSNSAAKYKRYEMDLAEAQAALRKLKPQIQTDALGCLAARKGFLKKGGDEKLAVLWDEYQAKEVQFNLLVVEWEAAQKKATPEISQACRDAKKYVMQGADVAYERTKLEFENASGRVDSLGLILKSHNEEVEIAQGILDTASECAQKFNEEDSPSRILKLKQVLDFVEHIDDVDFMQRFNTRYAEVEAKAGRFVSFQASVNFERATAYYENLGKSDADLVNTVNTKKSELAKVTTEVLKLSESSKVIRSAEIPAWTTLRKAIHEFAYEIGSQAAATQVAHTEFGDLEEGVFPVEAHALYADLETLRLKIISTTIDVTVALPSLISEQTFKIQGLNPKESLATFFGRKNSYELAANEYVQKNKAFCEKARLEAGKKLAPFNELELSKIEGSTPEQISSLMSLFERLNLTLNKDRDDANKAIQAAQNANEETLTQLSSLIRVAEDNLDAMKKVMSRYPNGCFKIKVQIAGEDLIKEILSELKIKIKGVAADAGESGRTLRRSEESKIKDLLRETLIDKVFLEPKVTFIHGGIRAKESLVTEKLSTGQKVALEFMWIVRQAEYEIERGLKQLSSKQAEKKRQMTNRVIFVDGIFSTLSDRQIIREAFSGLNELGGNFQIIGFLHSPTWTNDSSVFPVYHVGKKLMNTSGSSLVAFTQEGRKTGTLGFLTTISQRHESTV